MGGQQEGGPWRPATEAEDNAFQQAWCVHCREFTQADLWEDEFGNEVQTCGILDRAFYRHEPRQLKWRNGEPICTDFKEDPDCPVRCPFTMEMF